jgi:hypothetical protein
MPGFLFVRDNACHPSGPVCIDPEQCEADISGTDVEYSNGWFFRAVVID